MGQRQPGRRPGPLRARSWRTCPGSAWPPCCSTAAGWPSTARSPIGDARRLQRLRRPAADAVPDARLLPDDEPAGRGVGRAHLRDPRRAARRSPTGPAPSTSSTPSAASSFDDVTFRYGDDGAAGARRLRPARSSRARPSPSSGRTGSGKSTVARLLPRFYDVDDGAVLVDGHDVRDLTAASACGRHVGIVLDEPFLFSVVGPRQHRLRPARRRRRRGRGRGPGRPGPRLHQRAARGLRHRRRRAGLHAVRRPAPAHRHRPHPPGQPPHPRPRRRHQRDRRPRRGGDPRRARDARWPDRTTIVIAHRLSTIALADRVRAARGRPGRRRRAPTPSCWPPSPATPTSLAHARDDGATTADVA